ncbi:MAG: intermembrane transport protein PqiB [Pseudomonadales bacterium]
MNEIKPQLSSGMHFSVVWILPLVALILGAWALVYTLINEGPEIKIRFETAHGLEAGKTKVRYRSVDVGVVEEVRLSADHKGVVAMVKLHKETRPLLREGSRFWVVTAQVSGGGVSGLDTLLSGAYIEFSEGDGEDGIREFEGLNRQPQTPIGAPGLRLQLLSSHAHSISAGDPILFHGYKVGRVESLDFDLALRKIHYDIFIDAPYHELVDSSVRFWEISGVSFSATADGIEVNTGSMETILTGGITFARPAGFAPGKKVESGTEFKLFASRSEIEQDPYRYGVYYVVLFDQSLRGLKPGAAVEFRGIELGYVDKIMVKEVMATNKPGGDGVIPVLIYLEPGRLLSGDNPESIDRLRESISLGVANGLRASLATGNLLTGSLFVNLDFYPEVEAAQQGEYLGYVTLPTAAGGLQKMGQQITTLLEKINGLPLDDTVDGVNTALVELNASLAALRELLDNKKTQGLTTELTSLMAELREVAKGISPDSPAYQSLNSSLRDLNYSLQNLSDFTNTLSTNPNAIIRSVELPADPVPEAKK